MLWLKTECQEGLDDKLQKRLNKKQDEISLTRLESSKKNACGIGLRKVIQRMKKLSRETERLDIKLVTLLLETEFANLSAKQHNGSLRIKIYERKTRLLYQMSSYLSEIGWKYGVSRHTGKEALCIVYVYLPNGVQLSWHCNSNEIGERYPSIDAEWDGQSSMNLRKILKYIKAHYL